MNVLLTCVFFFARFEVAGSGDVFDLSELEGAVEELMQNEKDKLVFLSPRKEVRDYVDRDGNTNSKLCVVVQPLCEYLSWIL